MPSVNVKECPSFDVALRRFKRACEKAGVLTKLRQSEYYEKPTSKRKRKRAAAIKRYQKKLQKESMHLRFARRFRLSDLEPKPAAEETSEQSTDE